MHCMWCSGIQAQSQDTFSCADQDIVCLQPSNHHEDMDLAKILTTKWSRENYAIFMDSEPKYTIYVFYKRSLDC